MTPRLIAGGQLPDPRGRDLQPVGDGTQEGTASAAMIGERAAPVPFSACRTPSRDFDIVVRQAYIDRLGLTGAPLMVYSLIASAPTRPAALSQPYIAYRCGISRRHVKTVLDDLRARGLIACDRPGGADGPARWRTTSAF